MPTPAGFASCSYKLLLTGMTRAAYITFGIDPTATDPLIIAQTLSANYGGATSLKMAIDANVTMLETRVSLGTDGGGDLIGIYPSAILGGQTMGSTPPNVAALVHKRTARGGRRGRGRMYLPWAIGTANTSEAGMMIVGDQTRIQNAVQKWFDNLIADNMPLVILHRDSLPGTQHPTVAGAPNVVTSVVTDQLVATQRRRLGR